MYLYQLSKLYKDPTFIEYLKACPYFEKGVYHNYCNNWRRYVKNWKGVRKKSICKANCPYIWKNIERIGYGENHGVTNGAI